MYILKKKKKNIHIQIANQIRKRKFELRVLASNQGMQNEASVRIVDKTRQFTLIGCLLRAFLASSALAAYPNLQPYPAWPSAWNLASENMAMAGAIFDDDIWLRVKTGHPWIVEICVLYIFLFKYNYIYIYMCVCRFLTVFLYHHRQCPH